MKRIILFLTIFYHFGMAEKCESPLQTTTLGIQFCAAIRCAYPAFCEEIEMGTYTLPDGT